MTSRSAGAPAPAAHEQLSPVDGLAQLSFVILGMLERRAAEHDLSLVQTRLLGVLRDRKPTMNELARLLGLDKSSITGLVDRAERRGLVVRVPSATDRRAVLVSLTDDGRLLVSQASARFEADVSTMLNRLPLRDRATLSRLVSRLLVAHAAGQGIDLFATVDTEACQLPPPPRRYPALRQAGFPPRRPGLVLISLMSAVRRVDDVGCLPQRTGNPLPRPHLPRLLHQIGEQLAQRRQVSHAGLAVGARYAPGLGALGGEARLVRETADDPVGQPRWTGQLDVLADVGADRRIGAGVWLRILRHRNHPFPTAWPAGQSGSAPWPSSSCHAPAYMGSRMRTQLSIPRPPVMRTPPARVNRLDHDHARARPGAQARARLT